MKPDTAIANPSGLIELTRPAQLLCAVLILSQIISLTGSLVLGYWFRDPSGQLRAIDFVNIWMAGQQALNGNPTAAYDEAIHKAAQVAALGNDFEGEYPWYYPPTFLFPAALLALVPYVWAYVIWVGATFAAYVAVIRGIIGSNAGILLACAYPGVMMNIVPGQNGFLTAALIGGALLVMPRRPILSGILFGLLSFKPQLGIMIPIAMMASGRWNVIAAAAATTLALAAASWLAFGTAPWEAFFPTLRAGSQAILTDGLSGWGKLHSIYGIVRVLGGSDALAWALQGLCMVGTAIAIFAIWRSQLSSFEVKAAALAAAILLATPYVFIYDLVLLAVAMAFLLRAGALRGFLTREILGVEVACLFVATFPTLGAPVGFAAVVLVTLLIARRMVVGEEHVASGTRISPATSWSGTPKLSES